MQRSVEKPSAASPDVPVEGDVRIQDAKNSIGDYDRDVHEDHVWTEQNINTALNERLSKHEKIPVLQIYDFNADQMRAQATRILQQASKESRELTDGEEREMIAAQLRLTVLESLSGALGAYMDILDQYKKFKAEGMPADPNQERIIFEHLALVKQAADDRTRIAEELFVLPKNLTGEQKRKTDVLRADLQKQAVAADQRMMQLLASQDPSVPGANPEGILPAHRLILSMLKEDYSKTLKEYQDAINIEACTRAEKANNALQRAFPGRKEKDIATEDAEAVLQTIEPGYGLEKYHDDLLILENGQSKYTILKARGKVNVIQMADVNRAIGKYQLHRAELSSIRHHFDQAYDKNGTQKPFPGQTTDAAMNASRAYLDARAKGGVASVEKHLQLVNNNVLKVGFNEKAEKLWNENGRIWVTRIADQIATLETGWIPDLPFTKNKGDAAKASKEYLISGLTDALGWPRDEKGNTKPWSDLTEAEKTGIQEKQMSVEKAITEFRETGVLEKMQTSVGAAKALLSRTDLKAENFLQEGEIDRGSLPQDVVTDTNIDELVSKYGAQKVYVMCFVQLEQNWNEYSHGYEKLLTDFHEAIGSHYDFSRMMKDFAKKQFGIAGLLAGLGIAGWILVAVAGVGALSVLKYGTKKTAQLAWRTAKGGVNLAVKGTKKGIDVIRNTGKTAQTIKNTLKPAANTIQTAKKAVNVARTVDAGVETFKTYEELSAAIKAARDAKNNAYLAKLLKSPLIAKAAKAGNAEAKALLKLSRWLAAGKWALRALPFLCVLVDAVLIGINESEIADADATGNLGKKQTLEAKRKSLAVEGAAGASLIYFTSAIPVALPALLAGGYYTNSVYDSVLTWDKSKDDWLQESPEELVKELGKIPYNNISIGHRAGMGDSPTYRIWKNLTWTRKAIEDKDNERMQQVEGINQSTRQEILTAYFLQTMKIPVTPGESEKDIGEKVATGTRDRMQYVRYITDGTFDMSPYGKRVYDMIPHYADLMLMRRQFAEKERPIVSYEWNGQVRTLDLSPLDEVSHGTEKTDSGYKAVLALFKQYEDEVLPQQEAIRELQNSQEDAE